MATLNKYRFLDKFLSTIDKPSFDPETIKNDEARKLAFQYRPVTLELGSELRRGDKIDELFAGKKDASLREEIEQKLLLPPTTQEYVSTQEYPKVAYDIRRSETLLVVLRYALHTLYTLEGKKKFELLGGVSDAKKLYTDEYKGLDRTNTVDYLVWCLKNRHVYDAIFNPKEDDLFGRLGISGRGDFAGGSFNETKPPKWSLQNETLNAHIGNVLFDMNNKAISDLCEGTSDPKKDLPWVYGSGSDGGDLPIHLEWSYVSDKKKITTDIPENCLDPLVAAQDPSEALVRKCRLFDPKVLVFKGTEHGTAAFSRYMEYLQESYNVFVRAAKQIPAKDRNRVLEIAKKTQLKDAKDLAKKFERTLGRLDSGRVLHTHKQYEEMWTLVTTRDNEPNKEIMDRCNPIEHFVKDYKIKKMTAETLAKATTEEKETYLDNFKQALNKAFTAIGNQLQHYASGPMKLWGWAKDGWAALANTRAGRFALAHLADPLAMAKRITWLVRVLAAVGTIFGTFLCAKNSRSIAEGKKGELEALKKEKEGQAEQEVASIRTQALAFLVNSTIDKAVALEEETYTQLNQEFDKAALRESAGIPDEQISVWRSKLQIDFPARREYTLHEDKGGFCTLVEEGSAVEELSSWAGATQIDDWSFYQAGLEKKGWYDKAVRTVRLDTATLASKAVVPLDNPVQPAKTDIVAAFCEEKTVRTKVVEFVQGGTKAVLDMIPLPGWGKALADSGQKLILSRLVNTVMDTIKGVCAYAQKISDIWLMWGQICKILDISSLIKGFKTGAASYSCLSFIQFLQKIATKLLKFPNSIYEAVRGGREKSIESRTKKNAQHNRYRQKQVQAIQNRKEKRKNKKKKEEEQGEEEIPEEEERAEEEIPEEEERAEEEPFEVTFTVTSDADAKNFIQFLKDGDGEHGDSLLTFEGSKKKTTPDQTLKMGSDTKYVFSKYEMDGQSKQFEFRIENGALHIDDQPEGRPDGDYNDLVVAPSRGEFYEKTGGTVAYRAKKEQ